MVELHVCISACGGELSGSVPRSSASGLPGKYKINNQSMMGVTELTGSVDFVEK
jgi:hypothetical protein